MPSKIALTNQRTWTISQALKKNSKLHFHLRHPDSGLGELPWNARGYAKHKPALGPFRTFRQHGFRNNSRSKLICCWKSLPSINGRYGGKGTNQIASEVAHWCISLLFSGCLLKGFRGGYDTLRPGSDIMPFYQLSNDFLTEIHFPLLD